MTSLTVILSQKQNEWPSIIEKTKESNNSNLPTTTIDTITSPSAATAASETTSFNYMNIIKEKKMNQCSFCPKKFTKPSALKAHLYSHTGEKPHSCPYAECHRQFSLLSNLRRHIKIHVPAALKRRQQHRQHQQCEHSHLPRPSSAVATGDSRHRIHTLLPSPYTSCVKIFPGPSVQQQQQILTHHHRQHHHHPQYHTSTHIQTPI